MEQIEEALGRKQYPLIVSEGDTEGKKKRIEASSYLYYCQRRFENIQGSLFVYGSSLSPQDDHILDWLATNTGLVRLFVGIHGDPTSQRNQELMSRAQSLIVHRNQVLASYKTGRRFKKGKLEVFFFKSATAKIWPAKAELSSKVG